jgi:hypothetical protein
LRVGKGRLFDDSKSDGILGERPQWAPCDLKIKKFWWKRSDISITQHALLIFAQGYNEGSWKCGFSNNPPALRFDHHHPSPFGCQRFQHPQVGAPTCQKTHKVEKGGSEIESCCKRARGKKGRERREEGWEREAEGEELPIEERNSM